MRNGYKKHYQKYFTFVKTIVIDGISYDVDVDFLSGKYGGENVKMSKHIDGIKALPATGGNFAFDCPACNVKIEYIRQDGAFDSGHVRVISIVPYIIMKASALGRGKPKDAYDIYFCICHYEGGVKKITQEMLPYKEKNLIKKTCEKLSEKFASPDHAGPIDIVNFLGVIGNEALRIKQDSYQKVKYLVEKIKY